MRGPQINLFNSKARQSLGLLISRIGGLAYKFSLLFGATPIGRKVYLVVRSRPVLYLLIWAKILDRRNE